MESLDGVNILKLKTIRDCSAFIFFLEKAHLSVIDLQVLTSSIIVCSCICL